MTISSEHIKKLREQTGAGIMDCKKALASCNNDFKQAVDWLRKNSLNSMNKKSGRKASEGLIHSYIHGDRIGVLIEVNSETDFVARNEEFKKFVKDLSLHIAAMSPSFIDESKIPASVLSREKKIFKEQAEKKTKKKEMVDRVAEGIYKKWLEEVCLLNQEFSRPGQDKKQTVSEVLTELVGRIGENIIIRRFVRYELGQEESNTTEEAQTTTKG